MVYYEVPFGFKQVEMQNSQSIQALHYKKFHVKIYHTSISEIETLEGGRGDGGVNRKYKRQGTNFSYMVKYTLLYDLFTYAKLTTMHGYRNFDSIENCFKTYAHRPLVATYILGRPIS
jgi:hypothetical protein